MHFISFTTERYFHIYLFANISIALRERHVYPRSDFQSIRSQLLNIYLALGNIEPLKQVVQERFNICVNLSQFVFVSADEKHCIGIDHVETLWFRRFSVKNWTD